MTILNRSARVMSFILIGVILITTSFISVAHAATLKEGIPNIDVGNDIIIDTELVTIEDDEGNPITVEVTEITEIPNGDASINATTPALGTKKTFTVKIKNDDMGMAGFAGGTLTSAAKSKAAKAAAKAIAAKVGSKFLPGVGLASWILGGISAINAKCGNTGIKISCSMVYNRTWVEKEGHYVYGWGKPSNLSIKAY